jgi:tetratricopeptide (TPR) repeat protein
MVLFRTNTGGAPNRLFCRVALIMVGSLALSADGEIALDLANRAARLHWEAKYSDAEALYRRALDEWPRSEASARGRAIVLGNLGTLLRDTRRYAESETALGEAEKELETLGGPALADAGHLLDNLAVLFRSEGDLPKAASCAERATVIVDAAEKPTNRLVVASIYIEQRRYQEAEPLLAETAASPDARMALTAEVSLAGAALAQSHFPEAEKHARRALELAKPTLPGNHPIVAVALNHLAQACRGQGQYVEAESRFREAIATWEAAFGPNHPDLAHGLVGLAGLYHDRQRDSGAESLYRRAIDILRKSDGPEAPEVLVANSDLAEVLRAERRYTESDKLSRTAIALMEHKFEPRDSRLLQALRNRARLLAETNHRKEAETILKQIGM